MYRQDKLTTITNAAIVMQMPRMMGECTNQLSVVDAGAAPVRLSLALYTLSSVGADVDEIVDAVWPADDVVVEVVVVTLAQRQIVHPFIGSISKPFRQ